MGSSPIALTIQFNILFEFLVIKRLYRPIAVTNVVHPSAFVFTNNRMNDNVIKFKKREPVKPPRQTPMWLKRLLVLIGVIAAFALVYVYFAMTGGGPPA